MDFLRKEELFTEAKSHVEKICAEIRSQIQKLSPLILKLETALKRPSSDDREIDEAIYNQQLEQRQIFYHLEKSPYFVRCDLQFNNEKKPKTVYFSKFSYRDQSIYSWVTPIASIRFNSPGNFVFSSKTGKITKGIILRKDNFMIVDKKILFMATESLAYPRNLIYQEHFTVKKTDFILPEIVEQMEKAQDKIIRAHHAGSYLISGPAGSGKTTLAFHRIAYLLQSPDTEKLYHPQNVIVFVQDQGTRHYFSALLPELGINNVQVTTFDEWAKKLLKIPQINFCSVFIDDEKIGDNYELNKNKALQNIDSYQMEKNVFDLLYRIYSVYLDLKQLQFFNQQIKSNTLDRFDLAILLKIKKQEKGELFYQASSYRRMKNGKMKRFFLDAPLKYSLIVIDEAENYLKESLTLIKSCLSQQTKSIVYVGDLAQQTLTYTLKSWQDIQENFTENRRVVLQKMYRNTKQILTYIVSLGYPIELSNNLREGKKVQEYLTKNIDEEIALIRSLIPSGTKNVIGILTRYESYLQKFKIAFPENNIHLMTINEAQGVEFDTVFLVGADVLFSPSANSAERRKINRDLLYVALTRAMNELYIFKKNS